jgi:hypothetical protein
MAQNVAQARHLVPYGPVRSAGNPMMRRTILFSAVAAGTLAACGSGPTGAPVATGPIGFSTDAGAVVLEYTDDGGALARPVDAFQRAPLLIVTGDGQMILRPPPDAAIQGAFLPELWVQTITADGIAALLGAARTAGLFREQNYDAQTNITDQGTTTLRISTTDGSWTHEAYGLLPPNATRSNDDDVQSAREQLRTFVELLANPVTIVGDGALGPVEFFLPLEYLVVAVPRPAPADAPLLQWPAAVSVRLAGAGACVRLPQLEVGELFETAAEGSFFEDAGVTYDVFAKQAWPGATC